MKTYRIHYQTAVIKSMLYIIETYTHERCLILLLVKDLHEEEGSTAFNVGVEVLVRLFDYCSL